MQLPEEPIDAVLLDAGGVLMLPDPAALRLAFAPMGVTAEDETWRRAHYVSMREVDRLGEPDWPAVDRAFSRAAGVPEERLDQVVLLVEDAYIRRPWVPVDGAAQSLLDLEAAGFPLAIVSNAEGTMERQLADHRICTVDGGTAARVAVVVDSHVVGIEKPDPRIFGLALDALGVAAERSVYVGDTVHFDVEGARAAGLRPVHVDPYGLCPGDDHPHAESLRTLADALVEARRSFLRTEPG